MSAFVEIKATQVIIGADMDATVAQNPCAIGRVGVQQATRASNGKTQVKGAPTRLPARVKE